MNKNIYTFLVINLIICLSIFFVACNRVDKVENKLSVSAKKDLKVELGRRLFFDPNLSQPVGQSCASCHAPDVAFSDPRHSIVSEGATKGVFAQRNAPSISYATYTPPLHFDETEQLYLGGLFLDGRANSLQEQAVGPLFNPLEMNNKDTVSFAKKLRTMSHYTDIFEKIYGKSLTDLQLVEAVADALTTFQMSDEVNPFSSKFDAYLAGKATLTASEENGMIVFKDTIRAKCVNCHVLEAEKKSGKILFTDFSYDNIGLPKNPKNPFFTQSKIYNPLGNRFIDKGLGVTVKKASEDGKFRVPSLRNAAITAPYFHNGLFNTLEEVVDFYDQRDKGKFGKPEIAATMNTDEMGNIGLTPQEKADLVAFIKTLTDGYKEN